MRVRTVVRYAGAAGASTLAAALLVGCGIQGTDVVEAGAPAKLSLSGPANERPVLYFVSRKGELTPVIRSTVVESVYKPSPGALVKMLLAGPNSWERAAGMTTALPDWSAPRKGEAGDLIVYGVDRTGDNAVRVVTGTRVGDLPALARQQLICTVAAATSPAMTSEVVLTGTDGTMDRDTCHVDHR
ncbi:hypothetical protein [Streptomyces sp. NPDC093225]|uniref:hypothetical protein n=1 Tax=Streptomyces sp. NPDC093225 TaxID=3366034 RepID=UPI003828725E